MFVGIQIQRSISSWNMIQETYVHFQLKATADSKRTTEE